MNPHLELCSVAVHAVQETVEGDADPEAQMDEVAPTMTFDKCLCGGYIPPSDECVQETVNPEGGEYILK